MSRIRGERSSVGWREDRKSTRLNSSHMSISYAVFCLKKKNRIKREWGRLDVLVHSIAFSPKEALRGRVTDVERDGFLTTMEVSCWSFIRMAHLSEPIMTDCGTFFTMS